MRYFTALRAGALAAVVALAPGFAHAESLRQALEQAYTNNPSILSALLNVKATAENIALAKAGMRPNVALSGKVNKVIQTGDVAAIGGDESSSYSLGLNLSQNLFDSFKTDANIEQARALTELSKYSLDSAVQNIMLAVVQAYYNVQRDTQLVQLRSDNLGFFDAQLKSAEDRLELGEGTKIEVSQARARQAQAVASYKTAVAQLQTSQASYERYVGVKPRNLSGEFDVTPLLPRSIEAAMDLADANNPALLAARAQIRVAQAGVDAANSAFGPSLSLIGNICAVGCFGGDSSVTGQSAAVSQQLSVPIYGGGALGASVRKASLQQSKTESDALAARDQIHEAVISSWSSLQNVTSQIQSAESGVAAGQAALEGVIEERDVGQKTTLDVLNAQAEVTSSREGLISARSSRMVAAFSVLSAVGRLNAVELGLSVQVHSADGYIAKVEDVWAELRTLE
jgi:outer membrane protein